MPFISKEDKKKYNKDYYQKNKDKFKEYYTPHKTVKPEYSTTHDDYCYSCKRWLTRGYLEKHQQTALHKRRAQQSPKE